MLHLHSLGIHFNTPKAVINGIVQAIVIQDYSVANVWPSHCSFREQSFLTVHRTMVVKRRLSSLFRKHTPVGFHSKSPTLTKHI